MTEPNDPQTPRRSLFSRLQPHETQALSAVAVALLTLIGTVVTVWWGHQQWIR